MDLPLSLLWLRRDLRLHDHAALAHALQEPHPIQPVFVFDTDVLARFTNKHDRRLSFIADALCRIEKKLNKDGGSLLILHGKASELIPIIAKKLKAANLFAAEDYEPAAIARDRRVSAALEETANVHFVKDQLIFSPSELLKPDGTPYKVFTPYSKFWKSLYTHASSAAFDCTAHRRYADIRHVAKLLSDTDVRVIAGAGCAKSMLKEIGYEHVECGWDASAGEEQLDRFVSKPLMHYATARDYMGEEGTSRLSPYLRFGLISIRQCLRAAEAKNTADTWIKELIWREFYAMILFHYPESVTKEWNHEYRGAIPWNTDKTMFDAWRQGKTGYPIVDAAMRELLETGWMHNRARMITASFLTKHLLIDWRLGEEHFAQYLMDYEQASNVGGWQWAASTGTDAQPYFRVFNPTIQGKKFDPEGKYIKRFVPELAPLEIRDIHEPWNLNKPPSYPLPIVNHETAREKAISTFKKAQKSKGIYKDAED